jgi:hypothetical protein
MAGIHLPRAGREGGLRGHTVEAENTQRKNYGYCQYDYVL